MEHYVGPEKVRIGIVRTSTSRFRAMMRGESFVDDSSEAAMKLLREKGYEVERVALVGDEMEKIREEVTKALSSGFDVVIVIGGTGISKRDVSVEAVRPLLEKEIEGFGEVFRMESYRKVGFSAALSRCVAGVREGRLILALPGSPDAVETALRIIRDEIPHVLYVARM
jgi:molybdenum cofactor synthesis domain